MDHSVFSIFDNSIENYGRDISGEIALRPNNCYNHCPCARPAHLAKSWPGALLKLLQNSEILVYMSRVKPGSKLNWFLVAGWCQDLHFWIAQVEYRGQTRYIRILDRKPFMKACDMLLYWTHIGVETFSLHTFFAQCSSSDIKLLSKSRKLLQYRIMDGW